MDKFQRGKQVLHRVRLAAVMLAAILVAARPNPSYAVGVAIAEVRVDGQTIPRPTRTGGERPAAIQIPSSASRIRFLCTAGPEASPAADDAPPRLDAFGLEEPRGTRIRYRLDTLDTAWRDVPVRLKTDILFFTDPNSEVVGSKELLYEAETGGWKGDPDASAWQRHEITAVAPPLATGLRVNFLTAPNTVNIGIVAIDDVVVTVERPGAADPMRHELSCQLGSEPFHPLATPSGWQRLGSRSEISQLRMRLQPAPHPILVHIDDDPERYGNWSTTKPITVQPGDRVTLSWSTSSSIGIGKELWADYERLKPGNYLFRAELFRPGGEPTGIEASLPVEVYLPFHLRRDVWAGAGALALAGIGTAARAAGVRRMKRRLVEIEREHALERERARIARDLHDDVGAGLTEIAVQTDWLKRDVEQLAEKHAADVEETGLVERAGRVCTSAVDLIRSVDAIVWAVNPENDTLDRFVGYLTHSADQFARSAGVAIRLDVPEEIPALPLSGRVRHNLYLIVREALNNAVKHAWAKVVRLGVTLGPGTVTVTVADDGRGFPPDVTTDGGQHSGLDNMRRRADDIGGRLVIDSRPGAGTRIEITAPLA